MHTIRLLIVGFVFMVLISSPGFAQTQKSKLELMQEIQRFSNSKDPEDKAKAYRLSLEVIARFGNDANDPNIAKIRDYIRRYREHEFFKSYEEKRYVDFFRQGKEILVEEPNNLHVLINLAYCGFERAVIAKDKSFADDAIKYSRLAIARFDMGDVPREYSPFTSKDEALAWMYYVVGNCLTENDLTAAATNIYRSTLFESPIRYSSQPYYVISNYYEKQYEKLSSELAVRAKTLTAEAVASENAKLNAVIDRMIDAYARALWFAEKEKNPSEADWRKRLGEVYQFRKNTRDGLDAFIKKVISTPLPDPSKP